MMPSCDHTGTPRHFHSSTTFGSACLMSVRTRASVLPRQSLSSSILASMSCEGEAAPLPSFALRFLVVVVVAFFMVVPRVTRRPCARSRARLPRRYRPASARSHSFAGQLARLVHPGGELRFVEPVVLMDVEVARVLALGLAGRERTQRGAAEERHLHVIREATEAEEPALVLDSIERRVPFDCLAHAGD